MDTWRGLEDTSATKPASAELPINAGIKKLPEEAHAARI
jgi:hypothetical protein